MPEKNETALAEVSVPLGEQLPFDPLLSENIGEMIWLKLLVSKLNPLEALLTFEGAGIYALYHVGDFEPYES